MRAYACAIPVSVMYILPPFPSNDGFFLKRRFNVSRCFKSATICPIQNTQNEWNVHVSAVQYLTSPSENVEHIKSACIVAYTRVSLVSHMFHCIERSKAAGRASFDGLQRIIGQFGILFATHGACCRAHGHVIAAAVMGLSMLAQEIKVFHHQNAGLRVVAPCKHVYSHNVQALEYGYGAD
eukprot:m.502832 g.502832  ORF g.502832 m.502832 type:complete len:181 (+) comp21844_c1_seq4:2704-3246(+)